MAEFRTYYAAPPEVLAIQYTGENLIELRELKIPILAWNRDSKDLTLRTGSGAVVIHPGDFIINHEGKGETFHVMGPMEFKQKFHEAGVTPSYHA